MTKHEELARLAGEHSRQVFEENAVCQRFAHRLIQGLKQYLECPAGSVNYYDLDTFLRPGKEAKDSDLTLPTLRSYKDGFWYFAYELIFRAAAGQPFGADIRYIVGVRRAGRAFVVRLDKDLTVDQANDGDFQTIYGNIFEDLRLFYLTPPNEPPRRMGFSPPEQA